MEESTREQVREFYASFPADKLEEIRDGTAASCRHVLGEEPSADIVDDVLFEMGRQEMESTAALFSEVTDDEWGRLLSEEHARLGSPEIDAGAATPGVEEAALVDAVYARVRREHAYLLARRRKRPRGEGG